MESKFNPEHESIKYGANLYDPATDFYYKKSGSAVWKWVNWWLYLPCALIDEDHFLSDKKVIK